MWGSLGFRPRPISCKTNTKIIILLNLLYHSPLPRPLSETQRRLHTHTHTNNYSVKVTISFILTKASQWNFGSPHLSRQTHARTLPSKVNVPSSQVLMQVNWLIRKLTHFENNGDLTGADCVRSSWPSFQCIDCGSTLSKKMCIK